MSTLEFVREVRCSRARICELLLDRSFLEAFVLEQHPAEHRIEVDVNKRRSTVDWAISTAGMLGAIRKRAGETVPIRLAFEPPGEVQEEAGAIDVDLVGKLTGQLRAALLLTTPAENPNVTTMAVKGAFSIDFGMLSGTAASMAKSHLMQPILEEELVPLLEAWCGGAPAPK